MEDQITNLIKKYEKHILWLRTIKGTDEEELNALVSIANYKQVIQDLRKITDKSKYENKP